MKLGVEVQAKKRRIAVFHNCLPGKTDNVNPMTMHCGSPNEGAAPKWRDAKWPRVSEAGRWDAKRAVGRECA